MVAKTGAADRTASQDEVAGSRLVSIGSSQKREYQLDKQTTAIGSHPSNDVAIDETTVSRRHATIMRKARGFEVADLGSTNGTYVNGVRVQRPLAIKRGDEIRFGSARFAIVGADDPIPASAETGGGSRRVWQAVTALAVIFAIGFAGVRYRSAIESRASAIVAKMSSHQAAPAPSAAASAEPAVAGAPETSANPAEMQPEWLRRVNYYRAMVKLPPIVEDPKLSDGDRAHTIYIVKNFSDRIETNGLGSEMHNEDPGNPGFTPQGLEAAKHSDMDVWSMHGVSKTDSWGSPTWSIDGWMSLPFHRMPILNPNLSSAGFGIYCEAGACAAGLNLLDGAQKKMSAEAAKSLPIAFPPAGGTVEIKSFENEWPDPLTSCPGYGSPSGLAITIQLGNWMDTHLTDYSLEQVSADGTHSKVEACGLDSSSYSNPDAYSQELGRDVLKSYGTAAVIPRHPLQAGAKYAVSMTVDGKRYDWTFSIGS